MIKILLVAGFIVILLTIIKLFVMFIDFLRDTWYRKRNNNTNIKIWDDNYPRN